MQFQRLRASSEQKVTSYFYHLLCIVVARVQPDHSTYCGSPVKGQSRRHDYELVLCILRTVILLLVGSTMHNTIVDYEE